MLLALISGDYLSKLITSNNLPMEVFLLHNEECNTEILTQLVSATFMTIL